MSDTALFKCSGCRVSILAKHFKTHRNGKMFKVCIKCNSRHKCKSVGCDYACSTTSRLKNHVNAKHKDMCVYTCKRVGCDFAGINIRSLQMHILVVHKPSYPCTSPDCLYACSTALKLQMHVNRIHLKIKPFKCSYDGCDYACSRLGNVQKHIDGVHEKLKPFKCSYDGCNYVCSRLAHIQPHINGVHLNLKTYKCPNDSCDYATSGKSNLRRHMKTCKNGEIGSSGEVAIKRVLTDMKIQYEYNTSHEVKDVNPLRWDFIIRHNDTPFFIEYDGAQHYQPVTFGGCTKEQAQANFIKQQYHDKLKNDYCTDNKYILLRIPYTEFENILSIIATFARDHLDWGTEIDNVNRLDNENKPIAPSP